MYHSLGIGYGFGLLLCVCVCLFSLRPLFFRCLLSISYCIARTKDGTYVFAFGGTVNDFLHKSSKCALFFGNFSFPSFISLRFVSISSSFFIVVVVVP